MKTFIFLFVLLSSELFADNTDTLELRAFVPRSSKTNVQLYNLSSREVLVVLSSQVNSDRFTETQKIETEGVSEAGMKALLSKVVTNDRTIQYQVLINRNNTSKESEQPIILKISAN